MPKYIISHICRHTTIVDHIAEPRPFNWRFVNMFSEGQEVIPLFNFGCCSKAECNTDYAEHVTRERQAYAPFHHDKLMTLTSGLFLESKNAFDSVSSFNFISSTKKYEHGIVDAGEFEDAIQRANGWILCATALLESNAPHFFFDLCVAFAESVICSIIAMRISLDRVTESLPTPELALVCHPNEVKILTKNAKLSELAPQLEHLVIDATVPKSLHFNPRFESLVREMVYNGLDISTVENVYHPFSGIWRQKLQRSDDNQIKKAFGKAQRLMMKSR